MQFFLLALKHIVIIVLISLDVREILNNISGVKYHFVVRFPIGPKVFRNLLAGLLLFCTVKYSCYIHIIMIVT